MTALAVGATAVVGIPASGPVAAERGDLDDAFGGTGQVRTALETVADQAFAVAVDPMLGRVYVGAIEAVTPTGPYEPYVAAFTSAGALDPSFGDAGIARPGIAASPEAGLAVGVSPDGQQVYLTTLAADGEFAGETYVAAFAPAGSLDPGFSGDGIASTGRPGSPLAGTALAVDPVSGRVYIGALEWTGAVDDLGQQYVAAFTPAGLLDPTFGGAGSAIGGPGSVSGDYALALGSGRIYLASSLGIPGEAAGVVAAFTSTGGLDSSFGGFGYVMLDIPVEASGRWGLAVDEDRGRIYAASYEASAGPDTYPFVMALSETGAVDPSFGTDGVAYSTYPGTGGSGQSVAVDPVDGTVLLVSYADGGDLAGEVYVAAFTPTGATDATFGQSGVATTGVVSSADAGLRAVFDPAMRRLYVASYAASGGSDAVLSAFQIDPDPVLLSISDVAQAEGNAGSTGFVFTVSLSKPALAGGVTFDIATANNTAVANGDYVAQSLTGQAIPAGATTYAFLVMVVGDGAPEANETFFVNVTNVVGAMVVDGQGTGTIVNDDVAGDVLISPTSGLTTTEEGGSATFDVVLSIAPSNPVTVGLATSDSTEGTVSPAALTFDSTNWATPQTATVVGVDDALADGDVAFVVLTSVTTIDPAYLDAEPDDVLVTNVDDDVAGVQLTPPVGLSVAENGGVASLSVQLTSEPTDDVLIELISDDPTEGIVTPSTLTFTPTDWAPQTVSVVGVDDDEVDGDVSFTIVLSVASADPNYDSLPIAPVTVVNADDDLPPASTTTSTTSTSTTSTTIAPSTTTLPSTEPPGSTTLPTGPTTTPTAPATAQPATNLPETGGSLGLLTWAAALVALGATTVLGARTRARTR